jgi:hypothetical protein
MNDETSSVPAIEEQEPTRTQECACPEVGSFGHEPGCPKLMIARIVRETTEVAWQDVRERIISFDSFHTAVAPHITRLLAKQAPPSATTKDKSLEEKEALATNTHVLQMTHELVAWIKKFYVWQHGKLQHYCPIIPPEMIADLERFLSEHVTKSADASGSPESSSLSATTQAEGGEPRKEGDAPCSTLTISTGASNAAPVVQPDSVAAEEPRAAIEPRSREGQNKLLPCPFCGSRKASLLPPTCRPETPYNAADRLYPVIRCSRCYTDVPGKDGDYSGDSARVAWNTRKAPSVEPKETNAR